MESKEYKIDQLKEIIDLIGKENLNCMKNENFYILTTIFENSLKEKDFDPKKIILFCESLICYLKLNNEIFNEEKLNNFNYGEKFNWLMSETVFIDKMLDKYFNIYIKGQIKTFNELYKKYRFFEKVFKVYYNVIFTEEDLKNYILNAIINGITEKDLINLDMFLNINGKHKKIFLEIDGVKNETTEENDDSTDEFDF